MKIRLSDFVRQNFSTSIYNPSHPRPIIIIFDLAHFSRASLKSWSFFGKFLNWRKIGERSGVTECQLLAPRGEASLTGAKIRDARSSRSNDRERLLENDIHDIRSVLSLLYAILRIYIICSPSTKNTQPAHTTALNQGTYYQQIYRNTRYARYARHCGDEKKNRKKKREKQNERDCEELCGARW